MNLSDSWTPRQQVVSRISAAEEVFNAIRQGILNGEIPLGTKLSSEATLASSFGVSRSVIREALRSTATLGLTKTETGRGTFVISAQPTNDLMLGTYSAVDLYEARPHIEIPAAGLAATRRTADDLLQLQGIIAEMESEDDHLAWVELDTEFHAAIAKASKNSLFARIVGDIRGSLARQSETVNVVSGRREPSNKEHRAIVEAISAQDKAAAEAAMAHHLRAVQTAVDSILGKNS
ncbi:FadR/GntR family transcriptional regulator [Corynebacterium callunae]|uniref:FadR/GntR family transcriptional regulator n=1 Tax=Corynebacterium callunae TaxID=1721 RepID=UPI0039826135